jgi:hypothetical protein
MGESTHWKKVADTLAKEAAQDKEDRNFVYDRIPISTIASSVKEEGLKKWQAQWDRAVKRAICRSFFPTVEQRQSSLLLSAATGRQKPIEQIQPNRQPDVPLQ